MVTFKFVDQRSSPLTSSSSSPTSQTHQQPSSPLGQPDRNQAQPQDQSSELAPPNLDDLNISDIVSVHMIFLRQVPYTGYINEHYMTLPLSQIEQLHEERIERFDFINNLHHRDIGVLQQLSHMEGLPVWPRVVGPEDGGPADGDLEALRQALIHQLRLRQDTEYLNPKPIYIKCYLRYFREGDGEDDAVDRFSEEVTRQLKKVPGDWEDLSDVGERVWEKWVSDGPPGMMLNFRRWGAEAGEGADIMAPGTWETMYWVEGGLKKESRFRRVVEGLGGKTQADEPGWTGLKSKRVKSPERKKKARDSGIGMGEGDEDGDGDEELERQWRELEKQRQEAQQKQQQQQKQQRHQQWEKKQQQAADDAEVERKRRAMAKLLQEARAERGDEDQPAVKPVDVPKPRVPDVLKPKVVDKGQETRTPGGSGQPSVKPFEPVLPKAADTGEDGSLKSTLEAAKKLDQITGGHSYLGDLPPHLDALLNDAQRATRNRRNRRHGVATTGTERKRPAEGDPEGGDETGTPRDKRQKTGVGKPARDSVIGMGKGEEVEEGQKEEEEDREKRWRDEQGRKRQAELEGRVEEEVREAGTEKAPPQPEQGNTDAPPSSNPDNSTEQATGNGAEENKPKRKGPSIWHKFGERAGRNKKGGDDAGKS